MFLARVVGTVVAPVHHPFYEARKLLLVRPEDARGHPRGPAVVGVDKAGAGMGDRVLVLEEGSSARDLMEAPRGPLRTVVVGFVDEVAVGDRITYRATRDLRATGRTRRLGPSDGRGEGKGPSGGKAPR